ncbi:MULTISPECIES: hypothetical protein [unclassified Microbulbifer]|uniref:hypothetical protein n=1 Tax=unclassified Microbulbifer TaxID=2619833 RepID=UPI0027E59CA7|nr:MULTISPECIES: hypothetical protein [unclassified Microbulbifer]
MDLTWVIIFFLAAASFGFICVKLRKLIVCKIECFARDAGMKSTSGFFSYIEGDYFSVKGRLLSAKKVHKEYVRALGPSNFVIHRCQVNLSVEYRVRGKRYVCDRSIFSMVPNSDELLADKAMSLVRSSKNIKVYYRDESNHDAYIIVGGVKSWSSLGG